MRRVLPLLLLLLTACAAPQVSLPPLPPEPVPLLNPDGRLDPVAAARNFVAVASRMEPMVEQQCRAQAQMRNCDFQIVVDDRPGQPANAFQTLDRRGRPVIAVTLALIGDARNQDELAFILGHESAHHIANHIPKTEASAREGARIFGALETEAGGTQVSITQAQQLGAQFGARRFSKDFELEADALGTVIAYSAGYDPERGALFFQRLPDPGDKFLGTHPPNAQRLEVVRATLLQVRGY